MRKWMVVLTAICLPLFSKEIVFEDFFINRTLRVDIVHSGNDAAERIALDRVLVREGWAGNPRRLIDPFDNGNYIVRLVDGTDGTTVYSRQFASMFAEYRTTDPALRGIERAYHESVLVPCPVRPMKLVFESRDRQQKVGEIFSCILDPDSVDVLVEIPDRDKIVRIQNGPSRDRVDLVLLAEGYTEKEFSKFKKDAARFSEVLLSADPYCSHREKFNVTGVFRPSVESGVDEPEKGIFKNTALSASFNSFHLDRYLLTEDYRTVMDMADQVPCDIICILVNSSRYGGGGIYNHYAVSTTDNDLSEHVFLHEFGHAFAGLADEYFSSAVAYNEFYPPGLEPLEPNITAFLDPQNVKWENFLSPEMALPTPWGQEEREALTAQKKALSMAMKQAMNQDPEHADAIEDRFQARVDSLDRESRRITLEYETKLKGKVGVFEGAGYSVKGLYRPEIDCLMKGNSEKRFCKVCRNAIERMIEYYTR